MVSPLLFVFLVNLFVHLVNTLGATTINELLWILYNRLPTPTSKAAREQIRLKREVLRLKQEMNGVSAQDEFSKWAKIRRAHDKVLADFNKSDASIRTARTSFDKTLNTLRWLGTTGLRTGLQFWYARVAMFWIPQHWVPGYVEWLLAFPKAPTGSVSVQVWNIACASVIGLVAEAVAALWVLLFARGAAAPNKKEGRETPGAAKAEKKEL